MYKIFQKSLYTSLIFLSIVFLTGALAVHDGMETVIEKTKNKEVKKALRAFKQGGIERSVNTSQYKPDRVIKYAKTFKGTPHKMGGESREGIDCSGLVKVVHEKFGIDLPHNSHAQGRYGRIIAGREQLKKGDLVFFYNTYDTPDLITHSGIYLGNKKFIHTSTKKGVKVSSVYDRFYWGKKFLFGTRLR